MTKKIESNIFLYSTLSYRIVSKKIPHKAHTHTSRNNEVGSESESLFFLSSWGSRGHYTPAVAIFSDAFLFRAPLTAIPSSPIKERSLAKGTRKKGRRKREALFSSVGLILRNLLRDQFDFRLRHVLATYNCLYADHYRYSCRMVLFVLFRWWNSFFFCIFMWMVCALIWNRVVLFCWIFFFI